MPLTTNQLQFSRFPIIWFFFLSYSYRRKRPFIKNCKKLINRLFLYFVNFKLLNESLWFFSGPWKLQWGQIHWFYYVHHLHHLAGFRAHLFWHGQFLWGNIFRSIFQPRRNIWGQWGLFPIYFWLIQILCNFNAIHNGRFWEFLSKMNLRQISILATNKKKKMKRWRHFLYVNFKSWYI